MTTVTFDTLAFADTLQKAGMPKEQAEAFSRASQKAFTQMVGSSDVATRADIARLDNRMAELDNKMAELDKRLVQTEKQIVDAVAASQRYITTLVVTLNAVLVAVVGIVIAVLK